MANACIVPPHLTSATSTPLQALEQQLLDHQVTIENWLRKQWRITPPPLHCSVDVRNAGFKLSVVDTNLFPAGFNNLNPDFLPMCIQAAQASISQAYPGVEKILLIPEDHTRNQFYFESLHVLYTILNRAGFETRIGSLRDDLTEPTRFDLASGESLLLEPVQRQGNRVMLDDFEPCLVFLNNDLSAGVPPILQNLEQAVRPPLNLGWSNRLKSKHFGHYRQVCEELAEQIGLDPWLLYPLFRNCGEIDFMAQKGKDCLTYNVDLLLQEIRYNYKQHGIDKDPFVFIKADAGTYGMGIMVVHDVSELEQLNRKQRTRMSTAKGNQPISKVIIQEGVYSAESWPLGDQQGAVAEPVVYMLGQHVVGGFYRVHQNRASDENLNAPGMHFERLAFADCCNNPCQNTATSNHANRFYVYGVIARLALVAAARELKAN